MSPSHPELIYCARDYGGAEFHAMRTTIQDRSDRLIILVIDGSKILKKNLYPDENLFTGFPERNDPNKEEMAAAQAQLLDNQKRWKECWDKCGMVCVRGEIPIKHIAPDHRVPF